MLGHERGLGKRDSLVRRVSLGEVRGQRSGSPLGAAVAAVYDRRRRPQVAATGRTWSGCDPCRLVRQVKKFCG
ncbi:MAG: hypothetical protein NTY53_01575 [Kiritimatiellaeota bacterium]|nr:hypothetical protein [Kiritimatiellota bacterium]